MSLLKYNFVFIQTEHNGERDGVHNMNNTIHEKTQKLQSDLHLTTKEDSVT